MSTTIETVLPLPPWPERSTVPAVMFNPALMAVVIAAAANQYEDKSGFGMPWPLSFLIPPLVLHAPTREAMPKTSRTSLAKWVADNPVLAAGFVERATHMSPHVREGIRFGLREQILVVTSAMSLRCPTLPKTTARNPGDLASVVRAAGMLGRIFGLIGDAATVFATLRVQP